MTRSIILVSTLALLVSAPVTQAVAEIQQYTDENGVIHFSNLGAGKKYRKTKSRSKAAQKQETALRAAPAQASSHKNPDAYSAMINNACDRHGVDPALVQAVVKVESNFDPFALSRKGAMGLMQLMPQTALTLNVRNSFDPGENIDGGVKYLRYLIDRYEGNLSLALAAYNSGETAVKKWGTVPPYPETRNYVAKILKLYNGTGVSLSPASYTVYVAHGDDGTLLLTDDPYKHKELARKTGKRL